MNLEQIRDIRFHKARKGYMPDEVDEFIEEVIVAFEELLNAQTADRKKLAEAEQVAEACRAKAQSIEEMLQAARVQAEVMVKDAQRRSEEMIRTASEQAAAITAEAEQVVARRQAAADALLQKTTECKAELMEIYRRQMALVEAMPGEMPEETAEKVQAEVQPEMQGKMLVLGECTDEEGLPSLFRSDDDDDEIYAEAHKSSHFDQLQFGDDYEDPAARGRGLFRKKK
jgi:cell division initiation protein